MLRAKGLSSTNPLNVREKTAVDKAKLRGLALEAFIRAPTTQFESLKKAVTKLADERGSQGASHAGGPGMTYFSEPRLSPKDETDLQEVVWDLIVERVLTPGADAMNPEWPWLRLTERGRQAALKELGRQE